MKRVLFAAFLLMPGSLPILAVLAVAAFMVPASHQHLIPDVLRDVMLKIRKMAAKARRKT